jgi:hypothetical protein
VDRRGYDAKTRSQSRALICVKDALECRGPSRLFDHDLRFDHLAMTMVEIDHFLQWVMHQALDEELLLSLLLLDQQSVSAPVAIAHVLRHEAAEHTAQHGGCDDGELDVIRVATGEVDHGPTPMQGGLFRPV